MPQLFNARILWLGLLASQGLYAALLLGGVLHTPGELANPILLPALGVVAVAVAVVSFVLPAIMHRRAAVALAATLGEHGGDNQVLQRRAFEIGFAPLILSLALSESIAIDGLMLGAMGNPFLWCGPFFIGSVALTVARFPTQVMFIGPVEQALGRPLRL